jgi:hypothetical protein
MKSTNNSGRIAGRGVLVLDRLYRTLTHYLRTKPEFGRGKLSIKYRITNFGFHWLGVKKVPLRYTYGRYRYWSCMFGRRGDAGRCKIKVEFFNIKKARKCHKKKREQGKTYANPRKTEWTWTKTTKHTAKTFWCCVNNWEGGGGWKLTAT